MELNFRPREWQAKALDAWVTAGWRGVVEVVTGGGKTAFAEMCVTTVAADLPEAKFVVVVPTQALLDQWYVSIQEELGCRTS
jgi:superfamily II DNA or RNA helicase